jgi:hypothetical protein
MQVPYIEVGIQFTQKPFRQREKLPVDTEVYFCTTSHLFLLREVRFPMGGKW